MRRCSGASLFGLAPCGVLPAICLTADAVRSYRTFSPLPRHSSRSEDRRATAGGIFSVPLVLRVAPTGNYPAHCPAEFGLSSLHLRPPVLLAERRRATADGDHPAHHDGISRITYPSVSCEIPYCSSFL